MSFLQTVAIRWGTLCIPVLALFTNASAQSTPEPVAMLQEMVRYRSVSGQEKAVGDWVRERCEAGGLYVNAFTPFSGSSNLAASLYPLSSGKPNLILLSHLDVVPANDSAQWRVPPFEGRLQNDTLHGRGTIDCKGLLAMQMSALLTFAQKHKGEELPYNITLLVLSNEESGDDPGACYVIAQFWDQLNAVAVFGEGGSGVDRLVPSHPAQEVFCISVAEKSSLWLRLDVKDRTHGHGAVPPDLYANKRLTKALIKLLDEKKKVHFSKLSRQMFRQLGKLEGGLKGFVIRHMNWGLFWPFVKKHFAEGGMFHVLVHDTFVITEISSLGTGSANQINQGAYAVLDCRLLPGTRSRKFIRKVQNTVGRKITVTVLSESPNASPSDTGVFYRQMVYALKDVHPGAVSMPVLFPASTDNNFFRENGVPVYGIIPAIFSRSALESIHGSNEFIRVEDLTEGTEVYRNFFERCERLTPPR